MKFGWCTLAAWFLAVTMVSACGDNPEVVLLPGEEGGSGGDAGESGSSVKGGSGQGGTMVAVGGTLGSAGDAGEPSDALCNGLPCGPGQRCVVENEEPSCVDNTCDDLDCDDLEECQPAPGGGHHCVSIACTSDVECSPARFCDGQKCVDDVCESDSRQCDGNRVLVCSSNGGSIEPAYACGSAGYFDSVCTEEAGAPTGCTCEDDWDCPEHTACEAGACVGTGVEPSCTLPPTPFEEVLPQLEFRWGGQNRASPNAVGSPFRWSSQVATTPIVINLDDDNGDGRIDELDFPEIVFLTHHGDTPHSDGVVRAVHGGGPNKGRDYFALCGTTHWFEGDPLIDDCEPSSGDAESRTAAKARPGSIPAAGDIDGDGFPEIVVALETGGFQLLDSRGAIIFESPAGLWPDDEVWAFPSPAIANLDFKGFAEVVVGNRVVTFTKEGGKLGIERVFVGNGTSGTQALDDDTDYFGPMVCVADVATKPGLEIVAGTTLYRMPDNPPAGCGSVSEPCPLEVVWDASAVNSGAIAESEREAFCAVADVLGGDRASAPGPKNPLDGKPEVVLVANGFLLVLDGETGKILRNQDLEGGDVGGAPNVDDFDGDGFPEIATALADFYTVVDLQEPVEATCPAWPQQLDSRSPPPQKNPERKPGGRDAAGNCSADADCNEGAVCNRIAGKCVCLHNSWRRTTEDDSSRATSSSVFDFNGDGAAEVVYNDECYFRIYDGATGAVHLALPSLSRTLVENPVVADVDNDGNAEIVFGQNNAKQQCNEGNRPNDGSDWGPEDRLSSWPEGESDVPKISLPNGLEVWGDPSDQWVAARRIWNQHSYHVTNVTEGGAIPVHEPESWRSLNGRLYNTYRSQPRNYGIAPDLAVTAIQVASPDASCGELSDEIRITVQIENLGDLRVGPGVVLEFFGIWEAPKLEAPLEDENGEPIAVTLDKSLEPGASTLVTVGYTRGANGRTDLPAEVRAVIDRGNAERECNEANNEISRPIVGSAALADLRVEIDAVSGCFSPDVAITVYNDGAIAATDVLVRIQAGDPSSSDNVLGELTLAGPIEPGESVTETVEIETLKRTVVLWAIVDPLDAIAECTDGNNVVRGPRVECNVVE
ncbi:MAG: CARDB domain-containing protein [Pseudomonadota bacterium]